MEAISKYRKKPVVVEAVQWIADEMLMKDVLEKFGGLRSMGASSIGKGPGKTLIIKTLEGTMTAEDGDWIIRGVKGEFYPCKPDIFEATYEPADISADVDSIGELDTAHRQMHARNERLEKELAEKEVALMMYRQFEHRYAEFQKEWEKYQEYERLYRSYIDKFTQAVGERNQAVEALEKAEKFVSNILSFCGEGLEVVNWHQNVDTEPLDNIFESNMDGDELEVLRSALQSTKGAK